MMNISRFLTVGGLLLSSIALEIILFAVIMLQGAHIININDWILCSYIVISNALGLYLLFRAAKIVGHK